MSSAANNGHGPKCVNTECFCDNPPLMSYEEAVEYESKRQFWAAMSRGLSPAKIGKRSACRKRAKRAA